MNDAQSSTLEFAKRMRGEITGRLTAMSQGGHVSEDEEFLVSIRSELDDFIQEREDYPQ